MWRMREGREVVAWIVKWDGEEMSSDDLTMEELEAIEDMTGGSWSMLNPVRSVKDAKALLVVAMIRGGADKPDVEKRVRSLTVADIKDAFDWRADDADPLAVVATSTESPSGPRAGTDGRRRKSAKSA